MARALLVIAGVIPLLALGFPKPGVAPTASLPGCTVLDLSVDAEEHAFLDIINGYRAENGLQPLTLSANLNRAATWMATDMATNNRFGHIDSVDRGPFERTVDCGYPVPAGENLAAGSRRHQAGAAFELFRNSPGHNSNMLEPRYRQIGIARVYRPGSRHSWYWATNFGTIDDTAPAWTSVGLSATSARGGFEDLR